MELEHDFPKSPRNRNYPGHLFKRHIPRPSYTVESESSGSGLRNGGLGMGRVVPHTRKSAASAAECGDSLDSSLQGTTHKVPTSLKELFRGVVQVTQS